jgi:hypothetical protein
MKRFRNAAAVAAALLALIISAPSLLAYGARRGPDGPPAGLTVYGRTLWNLEALLHDTYGTRTTCLRLRDQAFVSATCGDLARYGYWNDVFVAARHSRFRLVRRTQAPALGNVWPVTVKGLYVSCGAFPDAFPLPGDQNRRRTWLVVLHGWALEPFTCR